MSPALPRRFRVVYFDWTEYALEVTAASAEEAEAIAGAQYEAESYDRFDFRRGGVEVETVELTDGRAAA